MKTVRLDDALVAAAIAAIAAICVIFRYLPMTDLPQHYAMVSIVAHHTDPAYGFGDLFTIDLVGRPYASVYLIGAALARVLPLGAAMRVVVAICTAAPIAGVYALLRAADRPRYGALLAAPFAFGHLWHWGFLNFLLGAGLLHAGLALVVDAERSRRGRRVALGAVAFALLFTHVHTFALLVALAPLFGWAFCEEDAPPAGTSAALRAIAAVIPAALLGAIFVLTTWNHAEGFGRFRWPGPITRTWFFTTNLAAGLLPPWPIVFVASLAAIAIAAAVIAHRAAPGDRSGRDRRVLAFGGALVLHVVLYYALPLQTPTANVVYPRQALLIALAIPPLLPALRGSALTASRAACALFAAAALLLSARHVRSFDADARSFDAIAPRVPQSQRVASMIFAPTSWSTDARLSPFLHFAAYIQAAHGGDISFSFANHWNIPVQYRSSARQHALPARIEWHPELLSPTDDMPYFDYLLYRSPRPPKLADGFAIEAVSGPWTLARNTRPLPAH